MRQMIALEPDDSDSLSELLGWLVERKAWAVVDEAAKRYADRFEQDPVLLYTLAQACEAQGNKSLAQETAERALKLNPENQRQHLLVAFKLQQRGRFVWSELEYRKTIAIGPAGPVRYAAGPRLPGRNAARSGRRSAGGQIARRIGSGHGRAHSQRPPVG